MYAVRALPIYGDAAGHQAIGSVTPGTPLQIAAGASDGFQSFTLDAWSRQSDAATLVAARGQRIVLATLTDNAADLKAISTAKDDYGNTWNEVELSGFVDANGLTANQDSIWAEAVALYTRRCGSCHTLPRTTQFTANQWPAIIKTMAKNAALQPDQVALLRQYLQTHSK
jgi:trimethylamine-N-oxide reductase cytochrome c-type subunit TorC